MVAGLVARGYRVLRFDNRDIGLSSRAKVTRPIDMRAAAVRAIAAASGCGAVLDRGRLPLDGAMVALALAECLSNGGAQLISLMVAPAWRRRGIGTGLLLRLKPVLAAEGIAPVEVRYVANALTTSALEPILERLGWQAPHTDLLLLEGHSSQLAAVGWSDRHPLQAPYSLVAWGQLSDLQRHATTGLGAPAAGQPAAQEQFQPDPQLSLVLLHHDEPVGWVLVQPQSVQVAWWVRVGAALGLVLGVMCSLSLRVGMGFVLGDVVGWVRLARYLGSVDVSDGWRPVGHPQPKLADMSTQLINCRRGCAFRREGCL
jgi:GNAT superfamily N-acetyltransferase